MVVKLGGRRGVLLRRLHNKLLTFKGKIVADTFLSNGVLRELLSHATDDERLSLTKLLDAEQTVAYSYGRLQVQICLCGGHGVTNYFRGHGTSYLDILDDIVEKLEIKGLTPYYGAQGGELSLCFIDNSENLRLPREQAIEKGIEYAKNAEEKIILKLLEQSYKKMTPSERLEFDNQVNEVAKQFGSDPTKKLAGTAGLIALGNLGGFATYTFLTTTMSAISMGTLSFGAYTTATTALSVALGPIGWAGLGAAAIYAYGKPKYQNLISIVALIGTIRQRIEFEKANKCQKQTAKKSVT